MRVEILRTAPDGVLVRCNDGRPDQWLYEGDTIEWVLSHDDHTAIHRELAIGVPEYRPKPTQTRESFPLDGPDAESVE